MLAKPSSFTSVCVRSSRSRFLNASKCAPVTRVDFSCKERSRCRAVIFSMAWSNTLIPLNTLMK